MKCKRLLVSAEFFFQLFTSGFHAAGYSVIGNAIPADARLVNVRHAWPSQIELLIESDTFDTVDEGDKIPDFTPVIGSGSAA